MFCWPQPPRCPGLFVTGTDTGVGKTAVVRGIAAALAQGGGGGGRGRPRVGLCKPFATGCRQTRTGWTGEDLEALASAAGLDPADEAGRRRLCPQAFKLPAAPAAAAEHERRAVDFAAVERALAEHDRRADLVLVEGIGGPKVPLDPGCPRYTVAEFAAELGYPVLVVARANLGTLSHTAMSVESLQAAGCRVVGLVLNDADDAAAEDPTARSNPGWLERMTGIKVLAQLPHSRALPPEGPCPPGLRAPLERVDWADLAATPTPGEPPW